jgi:thymidine kinase
MAKLYFRYGAMGSSKTANALMVKFNYEEKNQNVVLLKPAADTRDAEVVSRIGLKSPVKLISSNENVYDIVNQGIPVNCVIVDEAQFLTKDQVYQLTELVDKQNIPVICYGLRGDFQGKLFPGSEALLALSDTIEEVKMICWCGKKALMNMRISNGKAIFEGEQVYLGGNESYTAVCRKHWKEGKFI